jgi:2-polyprenyl-3-methyl-5-hydroxy-6-metoxy-1,4-benzoquinol methylase
MKSNNSEHKTCLISGSTKLKPLKGYERNFLVKSPVGFIFCSRIPSEEELENHYNEYSRNEYISPLTIKRYNELLDEFERYRCTGKLLDIGCYVGGFLVEAKKRGWDVYGTEYSDEAVEKCEQRGIKMHKGKLCSEWFGDEMLDIITSFEVIEHINNPIEEVKNIKKILRKGGLFYVTTPNFNALERFLLKGKYSIIAYPEHLSYYTKRTLNYLLTNNGFKKLKLITSGLSLTRIQTDLAVSNENLGSPVSTDEKIRGKLEKNNVMRLVKGGVNFILDKLALGSSMKGWYIKK